jgi:hypothetical protein
VDLKSPVWVVFASTYAGSSIQQVHGGTLLVGQSDFECALAAPGLRRKEVVLVLILALLLVLILFGAGFAVHLLWIAAAIFLVLWIIGFALGRGESAGTHRFYRW